MGIIAVRQLSQVINCLFRPSLASNKIIKKPIKSNKRWLKRVHCVTAGHKSSRPLLIFIYQFSSILKYRGKSTRSWPDCINDNISEVFYNEKCAHTMFYVCFKDAVNRLLSVWPDLYINMH